MRSQVSNFTKRQYFKTFAVEGAAGPFLEKYILPVFLNQDNHAGAGCGSDGAASLMLWLQSDGFARELR